jgi:Glyoxalase-like domain
MSVGFGQVVIDSLRADDIAGFWSALLERPVNDGANQFFAMIPASADGSFPVLMFLAVPEPRHGKNRMLGCGRHRSQNSCSPANGRANHTHRARRQGQPQHHPLSTTGP